MSEEIMYRCRWCPCVFSTASDFIVHLRAFGDCDHFEKWKSVHRKLERGY